MILKKVFLHPFGGLNDRSIDFGPSLNVVLGPNEAGKSTVFNAIQKVLFTKARLNKREFEKELKNFIPVDGDTCHVELEFDVNGKVFVLRRTWGATMSSELIIGSGAAVTDEDNISRYLEKLLPAKEGTFKSVLMTYQSGLSKTIENLRSNYPTTLHSLGDVLRKAVLETDGVSVDLFRERIEEKYDDYFGRWDSSLQRPENNRGIHNKWTKGVGFILKAYYEKEDLKEQLDKARDFEWEIDSTSRDLNQVEADINKKEQFINKYRPIVDSIQKRQALIAEIKNAKTQFEKYTEVNTKWPIFENEINRSKRDLVPKEKRLRELETEKSDAEKAEEHRSILEKFNKAKQKKKVLDNERSEFGKVKKLTADELDTLRKAVNRVDNLKGRLTAGKLSLTLTPKSEMRISVQKDLDEPVQEIISRDKPLDLKSEGRIRLEHEKWSLSVTSGEDAFEEAERQFQEAQSYLEKLFKSFGVDSLEEAGNISAIYQEKLQKMQRAEENMNDELGEKTYEELKRHVDEFGEIKEIRQLHEIVEELTKLETKITQTKNGIEDYQKKIEKYKEEYGDKKQLFLLVSKTTGEKESFQKELDALPPLPEDVVNPGELVSKFEEEKGTLENLKEEGHKLNYRLADLLGQAPDVTFEEVERQFREKEEQFNREVRRGEAVAKIRMRTNELIKLLDTNTYSNLKKDLEAHITNITGGRYKELTIDESLPGGLPTGFVRKDGELIPYSLLSFGTKDALGLSLRLVIGGYFLQSSDGVYVMDDPLVDMDPGRQEAGAEMLREFAEKKQLIIFTCHPLHADIIGGNLIRFN